MVDDFDAYASEKIDRQETLRVKEELKKNFGPPRKSLEIFEEDMMMDGEDLFLLRCTKPSRQDMFDDFSTKEKLEAPPRGKL